MRRVTCKDCRYVYDYDRDDFWPRCGSYNPPGDTGSTRLEQELLSRFGDARRNQTRAREQQAERAAEGRRHLRRRGTYASGGPAGRVQQTRRLAAILVVLVIVAVVVIAGLMTALDLYLTAERAPENSPAGGATAATEQRVTQGERFAYYDMECTADGMFSLTACRCIGACGLAPVMTINDEVYGRLVPEDIDGILEKYKSGDA